MEAGMDMFNADMGNIKKGTYGNTGKPKESKEEMKVAHNEDEDKSFTDSEEVF